MAAFQSMMESKQNGRMDIPKGISVHPFLKLSALGPQQATRGSCNDLYGIVSRFHVILMCLSASYLTAGYDLYGGYTYLVSKYK